MAKPTDAVTPILRNIQKDIAELRREVREGIAEARANHRVLTERMDAFEGYFTFEMGLTSRNQYDIKRLQGDVTALRDRVESLDPQT